MVNDMAQSYMNMTVSSDKKTQVKDRAKSSHASYKARVPGLFGQGVDAKEFLKHYL